MSTFIRTTLLLACTAIGLAIAIAVAVSSPSHDADNDASDAFLRDQHSQLAEQSPRANAPQLVATARVLDLPEREPVEVPYRREVAQQLDSLTTAIDEIRRDSRQEQRELSAALFQLATRMQQPAPIPPLPAPPTPMPAAQNPFADDSPDAAEPAAPPEVLPTPNSSIETADDDSLHINVKDSDIREVLELLSQQGGLNILASKSVTGTVTATLSNVDLETALAAILKSTGYVARREGNILYIGTPDDFSTMDQTADRLITRVYRPNYVAAADVEKLFTSLLTPEVGKVTVSSPSEIDIPGDQVKTGGNGFAGADVVIVRDYENVIKQLDQVFIEIDVKPRQVLIEAMILSVRLSDNMTMGVNFEALRDKNNVRLVSGSPLTDLANIDLSEGGLKLGFLDASLAVFIDALETVGDTNVIASPRLMCLNKQRAEIQIGEQLGYVSTTVTENSATQSVNFLDVGTLLRLRPNIANDGLIRLEVHPELSTGTVSIEQGLTIPNKTVTQVTTNVMCADGCTVILGGLIRQDLTNNTSQIPFLGSLPLVGPAFRQKTETQERTEIIVLLTPRIVSEPMLGEEGRKYGNSFTEHQSVYADKMSPFGKRSTGQYHLRKARAAYAAGDYLTALHQVNTSIHFDPQNRDATDLRVEIIAAGGFEDENITAYLNQGITPLTRNKHDYSREGYPWKSEEGFPPEPPLGYLDDHGEPGPIRTIDPQAPAAREVHESSRRTPPASSIQGSRATSSATKPASKLAPIVKPQPAAAQAKTSVKPTAAVKPHYAPPNYATPMVKSRPIPPKTHQDQAVQGASYSTPVSERLQSSQSPPAAAESAASAVTAGPGSRSPAARSITDFEIPLAR